MIGRGIQLLAPCALMLILGEPGRATETIAVQRGAELQQAIDRARPGDTITLTPGVVYSGNFVLPANGSTQFITIRTADTAGQPPAGTRVQPSHAGKLAIIQSPNRQPALRTAPGARYWRLQLLEFGPNENGAGDIITLGDGSSAQRTAAQVPEQIIIDRCYIHGDPAAGQKRGVALNSGTTTITASYISDIKVKGQEAQAIAGWNGPGPYTIENNYLEAAGENFMLGGADPAIPDLVTTGVTFKRNHLTKPIAWREQGWTVKNLLELKNARRVVIEANVMEYAWANAQLGYAIVLTPRNQDGKAPWATVEDVTIRHNIVRHAGGGLQIIGNDSINPSGPTRRVIVSHNLFYDIDAKTWGGTGAFALIGEGPIDVTIEHNTIRQSGKILMAYGGSRGQPKAIPGLRFKDNLVRHNEYGVHGDDRASGDDTLRAYFPDAVFLGNGIAGGDARRYPPNNIFIGDQEFDDHFVNAATGDYRLRPGSRFRGAASDKTDVGVDIAALLSAHGLRPKK